MHGSERRPGCRQAVSPAPRVCFRPILLYILSQVQPEYAGGGGAVMAESEGRASSAYLAHRTHLGALDIAAAPADRTTPLGSALAPGNDLNVVAEQRAPHRPKVSVMVITYNHEKYIAQALES